MAGRSSNESYGSKPSSPGLTQPTATTTTTTGRQGLRSRAESVLESVKLLFNLTPHRPTIRHLGPAHESGAVRVDFARMDDSRLNPAARSISDQKDRDRRIKEAHDLTKIILSKSERLGTKPPPYDFRELIGKGAYGRVYKCLEKKTNNLVAVKIIDIDDQDWEQGWSLTTGREKNIEDVQKEVRILRQLKDNNAKNVNLIHDAFDWHGQLWIVADYCTGGSVRTLMRPFEKNGRPIGLPEHFIIPIARELAIAVKSMHDLDVLHRDIKCANVYITETGDIQLGDFGIVGVLGHDTEKRKTVVGTPHWMPREVVNHLGEKETKEGYGHEVDIWSYGCTIFEMATGSPPYPTTSVHFLPEMLEKAPPRLQGEDYSPELRDLVAFCLNPDKNARPSASAVLNHHYLRDTSRIYPTRNLVRLIERFKIWEHGGGSRASLWMAGPADPRQTSEGDDESGLNDNGDQGEEWEFSTSEDFDEQFTRRLSQMPTGSSIDDWSVGSSASLDIPNSQTKGLSVAELIKQEHSDKAAGRGERLLNKVFDTNDPDGYQQPKPPESPKLPQIAAPSDLPLRAYGSSAESRLSVLDMLDLDAAITQVGTSSNDMRMAAINEETIKPIGRHTRNDDDDEDDYQYGQYGNDDRRATMEWNFATAVPRIQRDTREWKFETAELLPSLPQPQSVRSRPETMAWSFETAGPATFDEAEQSFDSKSAGSEGAMQSGFRPQLTHTATEPIGHFRGLSATFETAAQSPNRASVTSLIDLDAGIAERVRVGNEINRPGTASSQMTDATSGNPFDLEDDPGQNEVDRNRFSYHKPYASEGGMIKRLSHKTMPMHARGASLSSTEPDMEPPRPTTSAYRPLSTSSPQPDLSFSTLEQGLGMTPVESENNQWPSFSSYESFESVPQYLSTPGDEQRIPQYLPTPGDEQRLPRLGDRLADDHRLRTNGATMPLRSREPSAEPLRPTIDFPMLQPPHPDALTDMADDQFLEDELARMLDDCSYALTSVSRALHQHASLEMEDDEISSEIDSGFNSQQQDTEDENVDQLTARRKPRKLEVRSPQARV